MERVETNLLHLSRLILLSGRIPGSSSMAAAVRQSGKKQTHNKGKFYSPKTLCV